MAGSPAVTGENAFTDVEAGSWYEDAIIWAAANGIVEGYGDGTFFPDADVTREQMAAILYRYAEYAGLDVTGRGDLTAFPDGESVSAWAEENVSWAVAEGLLTGRDDGTLDPAGTATRAEIATILMRYCETVGEIKSPQAPQRALPLGSALFLERLPLRWGQSTSLSASLRATSPSAREAIAPRRFLSQPQRPPGAAAGEAVDAVQQGRYGGDQEQAVAQPSDFPNGEAAIVEKQDHGVKTQDQRCPRHCGRQVYPAHLVPGGPAEVRPRRARCRRSS